MHLTKHRPLLAALLTTTVALTGCSATDLVADDLADATTSDAEAVSASATVNASSENQASHFDPEDLVYDASDAVTIALTGSGADTSSGDVTVDGSTVTVTAGGVYALSGSLDGEVVVDAGEDEDVTLLLDGVDITNTDGAAITVLAADEAVVLLVDGSTNRLADGGADDALDAPAAALSSTADLTLAGAGTLVVDGTRNDGIAGRDGLVIASGTIEVTAVDDGIRGQDYVIIDGGTVTIDADGDGIKADNDEDADRGYILVTDGVIDVNAGDDGIQATTDLHVTGGELTIAAGDDGAKGDRLVTIDGGSITITDAFEGIESENIVVNDGWIEITSDDDGLNVADADADTTAATTNAPAAAPGRGPGGGPGGGPGEEVVGDHFITINGGTILITVTDDLDEQGDGIDANGHVEITGGLIVVNGPTDTRNSAIDYSGGSFVMTGGTFIGTNVDGRNSEGVGTGSTQASLYVTTPTTLDAGTLVHVASADGEGLVTFEPQNPFSVVVFSSPDLTAGESYDIHLGGSVVDASATYLYEDGTFTVGDLAGSVTASLG